MEAGRDLRISVNLSPRQFADRTLAASIRRILEDSGLEARWLELEVTESAVLLDAEAVEAVARAGRLHDHAHQHVLVERQCELVLERQRVDLDLVETRRADDFDDA